MSNDQIEFFIDTYNEDAYDHIVATVLVNNSRTNIITQIVNDHQDGDSHFLTLEGTWDSYRSLMPPGDEKGDHLSYSIHHYYED